MTLFPRATLDVTRVLIIQAPIILAPLGNRLGFRPAIPEHGSHKKKGYIPGYILRNT